MTGVSRSPADREERRDPDSLQSLLPDWAVPAFAFVLFIAVSLVFGIQYCAELVARKDLLESLARVGAQYRVTLDGREVPDGALVVSAIKRVRGFQAHHSSPTIPIRVRVIGENGVVDLVLSRDSQRRDEYWIHLAPNGGSGRGFGREAGRIQDPNLTDYLRRFGH